MDSSTLMLALIIGLAVFAALGAGYNLIRALQAREQLLIALEDVAADPVVLSDPLRRRSFLVRWADRYDRRPKAQPLRERLRLAYLPWKPSDFTTYRIALAAGTLLVMGWIFKIPLIPTAVLCAFAYFVVPRLFLATRRNAYVQAFESQLIEITQLLSNSMRAGMSIQQAIGQVVERLPEPASSEFRQTHHELMMGDNLTQALTNLIGRIRSRDLNIVVHAVIIQHQAGGNLARVLGTMSNILTERRRLASEIRSLTADARFSAVVVMCIPIAIIFMLRNTPLGEAIFETPIGWVLLALFILAQIGNYLLIQRVARIDV